MDLRDVAKQPSVTELPKQQIRYIIAERFNSQTYDYLGIADDPFGPLWIPSHLANAYYADEIKSYFKSHTELSEFLFVPHAQFYKNGKVVSIFHYPPGDLYIEKLSIEPLPIQLPQKAPDFNATDNRESAAAKTLLFPYPAGKTSRDYTKIKARLQEYPLEQVEGEFYSSWGVGIDVVMLVVEYYRFKGKDRMCLYGFNNYFTLCSELYKYGIFCSRNYEDDVNCCIIDDPNDPNLAFEYEVVIAATACTAKGKRKFLCLEHAEFRQSYAEFLFPGVSDILVLQRLFVSVELGYISNIFNANNQIQSFLSFQPKAVAKSEFLGSSAYIYTYQPGLCECARVKAFLDADIVAERFLGDNKARKEKISTKSAVAHLNFGFHTLGGILKALWISGGEDSMSYIATERMHILNQLLETAQFFDFSRVLIVVPDELYRATERHLAKLARFSVSCAVFSAQQPEATAAHILLLKESSIYALALTQKHFEAAVNGIFLPSFVVFPFTSTRQMEVLTESIYEAASATHPCMFSVVAEGSIEEQIMVYREELCCESLQEYVLLGENLRDSTHGSQPSTRTAEQYYDYVCERIAESGFDCNYRGDAHVYDYTKLGLMQQTGEGAALCDRFCEMTVNRLNENELILEVSLQGIFNINRNFNIHVLFELIYGSKFETANKNSPFYENSAMSQLEIQLLDAAAPFYELDEINSFYYLCNANFDRGVQVYNNNQLPSIMNQQAVLEQINKYAAVSSGQTPQALLESFLKIAHDSKITEFHSYNIKPTKNLIKEYCYVPLTKMPFTNNQALQQVIVFERNSPLDRPPTLCNECALFTKQKPYYFGKTCDLCEHIMESIADDCAAYRYVGNQNQVLKIANFMDGPDYSTAAPADFMQNVNLCAVSYAGGTRWDNIVLRGPEPDVTTGRDDEFLRLLEGDFPAERVVQALNLLDSARIYALPGAYQGLREPDNSFSLAAMHYAVSDYVLRNGGALTAEQINSFEYVPFARIARRVVNYELFVVRNQLQHHVDFATFESRQPCTSLYDSTCQLLLDNSQAASDFNEFIQFVVHYHKHVKIASLGMRFMQQGAYNFIEAIIKTYLGQLSLGVEFTQELISTAAFYTKCLAFDNLLIHNVMTNIMFYGPKESIFNQVKISMRHFMTQELLQHANLFAIHRYYSQIVKTTSSNGSSSFLPSEQLNQLLDSARQQTSVAPLNRITAYGYNAVNFLLSFSNLDTDIRVYNAEVSGYSILENTRKFAPRKFVFNQQAQKAAQSVPQTPREANAMLRSGSASNQNSAPFSSKPVITKERPFSDVSQEKILMDSTFASGRTTPQSKTMPLSIAPHVMVCYTSNFYAIFESTIKKLLTISIAPLIRRLSDHFYPFALYSKRNILYVPDVEQIQAGDILNYVFNQLLPKNFETREDPNFEALIEILARDFSMQHGEGKLYRYVRNDYKQKLMEIVAKNAPQNLWYYDNCELLVQHLIKRYVLCSADFNKESLYIFRQDPAMGTFETESAAVKNAELRYCMTADSIFECTPKQAEMMFEKCYQKCAGFPEMPAILASLKKIGLSIGSTPLDVYKYFFMGKQDEVTMQKIEVIEALYTLLLLCYHFHMRFPFLVGDRVIDAEGIEFIVHRQETIKLVTLKIQSESYITYLQTIANLQNATSEDKRFIEDIIQRHTTYNEEITLSDKTETSKLAKIRVKAQLIEKMNFFQMNLDAKYARFYTSDKPGMQFKQQNFDKFALNELDKCGLRKAYIYASEYKMLFLALFGMSSQTITNLRLTKQISESQFDCIIELYANILNIWSRFHDYIFYICMTECGYESTYERISESDNKRQYFEPLKNSLLPKDVPLEQSALYSFYLALGRETQQTANQPFLFEEIAPQLPQYEPFCQFASKFRAPTTHQILLACQAVTRADMFPIESYPFDQAFCQMRQKQLISALFCERILYSDPLQTKITDPQVDLLGANPILMKSLDTPVVEADVKTASPPRKAMQSCQPDQKMLPSPQHYRTGREPMNRSRTSIPEPIETQIEQQPLEYYKQPKADVEKYVLSTIRSLQGDMDVELDQLLFFNSSCQKEQADVWGRLYSFLITEVPAPLEQLTNHAQQQYDTIKQYAIETMRIDRSVSNSALFDMIESKCSRAPSSQRSMVTDVNRLILGYIEAKLDIAYFYAFSLREDLIEGAENIKVKRDALHKALQSIHIMKNRPLNDLFQLKNCDNKRKMALATFIFLNTGESADPHSKPGE